MLCRADPPGHDGHGPLYTQAKNFKGLPLCGYTHEGQDTDIRELGFGVVHESRMYMDMCKLVAGHDDPSVSIMAPLVCGPNFKPEYEVRGADSVGELSQAAVLQLVRCGLTPALDLVRASQVVTLRLWRALRGSAWLRLGAGGVFVIPGHRTAAARPCLELAGWDWSDPLRRRRCHCCGHRRAVDAS